MPTGKIPALKYNHKLKKALVICYANVHKNLDII